MGEIKAKKCKVIFYLIIFSFFCVNLFAESNPLLVSCSYSVNGSSLTDGYKFWKTPGIPINYYSVTINLTNLPSGNTWAIYTANSSGVIEQVMGSISQSYFTFNFNVSNTNSNYPNGSGYRFRVTPQGAPSTIWCESPQFYISSIPVLTINMQTTSPLISGSSATVTWSVSGGIPGLTNGGWIGDIRLQWYQNSSALENLYQLPVSNYSYTFIVPSSISGGTIPGSNFRIAGANAESGTSIPGGAVFNYTSYFSINYPSPPNPPTLTYPINNSVINDLTPDLAWTGNGMETGYWGQVSTNSSFSNIVAENQNIQSNNWTPTTLSQYTTYYWRIKGRTLTNNWGNWSSVWSFTVANQPTLIYPVANSTVNTSYINFQWSDCSAQRYELYVDNNSGFGSPEISKYNITALTYYTGTSFQISGNWLSENVYYWKVIAFYSNGTSATSSVGSFTYSRTLTLAPNWVPVYRAYKSSVTDHFYCTSIDHLVTAVSKGYDFEKVDGYLSLTPFQTISGLANIYRIYIGKHDSHYYTSNSSTKDSLIIADTTNKYEGIIGYGYTTNESVSDLVKFYYLFKPGTTTILNDHFYTISDAEKGNGIQNGYSDRGFIAYVSPNGESITEPWMEAQPEIGYGINPQNGNVGSYNKTSFNIPGATTSLGFMHIYNSYTTRLMSQINSMGAGWSHSYMASLIENNGKYYVIWPGGGIHIYRVSDNKPITLGVYDVLAKISSTKYQITKKDQFVYTFEVLNSSFDPTAYLTSIKDRNNNTISCNYDSDRRLISVSSPEGRTLSFTYYTASGKTKLIKDVTDPAGRIIKFEYDNDINLVKFTDAKNQITQYAYDTTARYDHLLKKITFPKLNTIENIYLNKKIVNQNNNSGTNLTLAYGTNYSKITDENLKITEMYYTASGLLNRLTRATVNSYLEYNDAQNPVKPTKITDGKGYITTITYDTRGNPLQINKPENTTHLFTYNSFNDVIQYTDPRNKITYYGYNGSGNLISIQTPRGTTNITYNSGGPSNGTINTITDPMNRVTTLGYNSYGNITSSKNNLNFTTNYLYDNISRMLSITDANSKTTNYTNDNNDNVTLVSKPGSINTAYGFDANDNLNSITNPNNQTTIYSYNNKDLLQSVTNPISQQTGFDYFDNLMLKTKYKPNGQNINYTYDQLNRLTQISGAITGTYTYDNNNNITGITDVNGSMSYTYDALNRLTSYTDYYNNTVSYGYDQADNITTITYPGNKIVTYTYYDDNLLQSVTDWNNKVTTYTYNSDGSLNYILYPNMTKKTYSYDGAGRITGISNTKSDNSIISNYNFTLDNIGNHLSVSRTEPFAAPILSTISKTLNYNNADRIISDGTNSYNFDQNGNLIQKTGSVTSNYGYDGENRLLNMSGEYTASFKYDILGNRRYSSINGVIKKYILDVNTSLPKVLMETDNSGTVLNYYIHGLELISRIKPDGTTNYYHSDFRGSIIAITDAVQNITHKYSYGAFGELLQSNEANSNLFKYVGSYGVMEEGYGLYFMRARYYDSKIGRFISEDPIWDVNLFRYAEDNPVIKMDPNGLTVENKCNQLFEVFRKTNIVFDLGKIKSIPWVGTIDFLYSLYRIDRYNKEIKSNPKGKTTESKLEIFKVYMGLLYATSIPIISQIALGISLETEFIEMEMQVAIDINYLYKLHKKGKFLNFKK